MKILVTGSSGRLGAATVTHLQVYGHSVTGIDVVEAATTHVIINIHDKQQVNKLTQGYDAIIHTAAIHGKHYELGFGRESFIDTNIYGTLNLLNACVENGISKFLYTSTTSIYGEALVNNEQAVWVDELLAIRPRDIYDITKQTAEQLCRDFFYKEGIQASVYRVGRFLPENDNLRINHSLYRGLDERDGAEALRLALDTRFNEFEILNISSGSPFGKNDLQAIKHHPQEVILTYYYPQAEEIYHSRGWQFPDSIDRVYICDKAKRLLKYQPKYTFDYLLNN
jgi:nucleoside-diphosphate-sugar epimerase